MTHNRLELFGFTVVKPIIAGLLACDGAIGLAGILNPFKDSTKQAYTVIKSFDTMAQMLKETIFSAAGFLNPAIYDKTPAKNAAIDTDVCKVQTIKLQEGLVSGRIGASFRRSIMELDEQARAAFDSKTFKGISKGCAIRYLATPAAAIGYGMTMSVTRTLDAGLALIGIAGTFVTFPWASTSTIQKWNSFTWKSLSCFNIVSDLSFVAMKILRPSLNTEEAFSSRV